ncbi:hypothetical protein, partial [Salmonella enterica]
GKTSHAIHDTFRELHQQTRCNADEQAADAVRELAQWPILFIHTPI